MQAFHLLAAFALAGALASALAGGEAPASAATASIDLAQVVRPISRDLFGNGNPGYTTYLFDANEAVAGVRRRDGATLCRTYIGTSMALPQSTIEDFLADRDGIQDPGRWPGIGLFDGTVELLHRAGYRIILGIEESPTWNSWSGTRYGMPKDWRVHELMVQAIVRRYAGRLAMIEVKNEPDAGQTDPKGSPYASRFAAWRDYFLHTHAAVRAVDARLPVGGPCTTGPGAQTDDGSRRTWLAAILGDPELKDRLGFLSLHTYMQATEHPALIERTRAKLPDSMRLVRGHFAKAGREVPVYMTEWCDHNTYQDRTLRNQPRYAPTHVATALAAMMRTGMAGAAYFAINDGGVFRLYDLDSGYRGAPERHGEVFRLLSRTFRLEEDRGRLCASACSDAALEVVGGWGGAGDAFAMIVNPTAEARTLRLAMTGTGWDGAAAHLETWIIDEARDGRLPTPGESVALEAGTLAAELSVPPYAVLGVRANLADDDLARWLAARPGGPAFALADTSTDFAAKTLYYPAIGDAIGVLRTHPDSAESPSRLGATVAVAAERPVLRLRAAGYAGPWRLEVRADGRPVAGCTVAGDGVFRYRYADLSACAGRSIRLELDNADAGGPGRPFALWETVELVGRHQEAADRWMAAQGLFAGHRLEIAGCAAAAAESGGVLRTRPAGLDPARLVCDELMVPQHRRQLAVQTRADGAPWRCDLAVTAGGRTTVVPGATVADAAWSEQRFDLSPWVGRFVALTLLQAAEGGRPADGLWRDIDLAVPRGPADTALAAWTGAGGPAWRIASPGTFTHLPSWEGTGNVLRLQPLQAGAPAMISARLEVPADRRFLRLAARGEPGHDVRLRVVADGTVLLSEVVAGEAWTARSVDLGRWAGRRIILDLIAANGGPQGNWDHEACHLGGVELAAAP